MSRQKKKDLPFSSTDSDIKKNNQQKEKKTVEPLVDKKKSVKAKVVIGKKKKETKDDKEIDNVLDSKPILREFIKALGGFELVEFLLNHPDTYYSKSDIIQQSKISHRSLNSGFPYLINSRYNIVSMKKTKGDEPMQHNIVTIKLNEESSIVKKLQELYEEIKLIK